MSSVTVGASLRVFDPPTELVNWVKKELSIANPDYEKKIRMGYWVGNTPSMLNLYTRQGDIWMLPYGCLNTVLAMMKDAQWRRTFPAIRTVDYGGEDVPLYDYQLAAVNRCRDAQYGILQAPAGSGKTQMGIALIKAYRRPALWLTHTHDLLEQSVARAKRYMDEDMIGTIEAGKVHVGKGVTFATIQTMASLDLDLYADLWDMVICDECHRVAGSPTTMTRYQKVLSRLNARHKYGLSATVHRADGMIRATYALIGEVCHKILDSEVGDKVMQVTICPVATRLPQSTAYLSTDGMLNHAKLISYMVQDEQRNEQIAEMLTQNLMHHNLVLSDRVAHLKTLMDLLPPWVRSKAALIDGKMTSKTAKAQRHDYLQEMRTGEKRILFATYALAKEGLDIQCLDRLYLATPQKDFAIVTQSIGRIARTAEQKETPIAYDFVDEQIGYCRKAYKTRCTTYRKNGCMIMEGE